MRMELTRRGDYAVRAMLVLAARSDARASGPAIAAQTGIPRSLLPQVMGDLVRGGLVRRHLGRGGGYSLATAPSRISLLEVIESVEGDRRRTRCVMRGGPCRPDGRCLAHDAFFAAQEAFASALAEVSLADLVGDVVGLDAAWTVA